MKLGHALNAEGAAPVFACRAWVNFNGLPLNGAYSQAGTTVTVTMTAHGMSVGQKVDLIITSGTAVSGSYTVATVPNANTFTYTAGTNLTTSGNVTRNIFVRASGNVSSITDNGVGDHTINFSTSMPDTMYSIATSSTEADDLTPLCVSVRMSGTTPTLKATNAVRISTRSTYSSTTLDISEINLQVFR